MGFIKIFHHQFGIIVLELGFQASNMQIQDVANRPERAKIRGFYKPIHGTRRGPPSYKVVITPQTLFNHGCKLVFH